MMSIIIGFILSPMGRILAGLAAIGVFVTAFALDQRSRGAKKAFAQVEKANANAVEKAHSVRVRSRSSGVRDPHSVD